MTVNNELVNFYYLRQYVTYIGKKKKKKVPFYIILNLFANIQNNLIPIYVKNKLNTNKIITKHPLYRLHKNNNVYWKKNLLK